MLLVGDVGGTKTDLAIYSTESSPKSPVAHKRFRSADYVSLQAMVREFLSEIEHVIDEATFGVAGPVIDKRVSATNLPWIMDEFSLANELNLKSVRLINDLEAVAYAVPLLHETDIVKLNIGTPIPEAPIGVIAPGTGMGESFLIWNGSRYVAQGSEGGHANFAPANEDQIHLLEFLQKRFGHVSVERVCSGVGLPNIYEYLRDVKQVSETPEIAAEIASTKDRTKAIVDSAINHPGDTPLCRATVDMFASILANEAGNLALRILAMGGIYLFGGLAVHTLSFLQTPAFMEAFTNKGRFVEPLRRIPVHVITADAALTGAAAHALQRFEDNRDQFRGH
jgi:glucokinase